jgi:hypothetical protein
LASTNVCTRADIFAVDVPWRSATAGPAKNANTLATTRNGATLWRLLATDEAGKDNGEGRGERNRPSRERALFAGDSALTAYVDNAIVTVARFAADAGTEAAAARILTLPLYAHMRDEQVELVTRSVLEALSA